MNTSSTTKAIEFRKALEKGALVADGAMGTMLYDRGVFINRCFDELNLSQPALVKEVHEAYIKAGAEILESNTFGGNRVRLAAFGMAEKLVDINQAGVRLAREAAKEKGYVAGAMGPLGVRIEPLGSITFGIAFCFTDGVSTVTLMSRCIGFKLRTSLFNNLMCSGVVPQQPPISFTPLIRKRRAYCDMYSGEHI